MAPQTVTAFAAFFVKALKNLVALRVRREDIWPHIIRVMADAVPHVPQRALSFSRSTWFAAAQPTGPRIPLPVNK